MEKELIVKWKISRSSTAEVLKLLPELTEKTKNEKGNLSYSVYQSESNPDELILHERYIDEAALEAHKNSDHYKEIVVAGILPYLETREVHIVQKLF